MKRIFSCLLCALLLLTAIAGVAEGTVPAQPYVAGAPVDMSENTHASAYDGLWSNAVEVNGIERSFCLYTPRSYFPWQRLVMVLAPNGMTAEGFANSSHWMKVSEENSVAIAFLQAQDGKWADLDTETAYINAVIDLLANYSIDFIKYASDGLYLVGYGEGATLGQQFVLMHPAWFAGVAMFGAEDLDQTFIAETAQQRCFVFAESRAQTIDGYLNSDCYVPYWIVNDGNTNAALIDYLQKVNETEDERLQNRYARVYNQRYLASDGDRNAQALSRVWVGDMKGAAESYKDYDLTCAVWTDFLSELCRYMGPPMGTLRAYYTLDSIGAKVYTEVMEHASHAKPVERMWAVYAPSDYDGSEALPLVVATHGFTGTYDMFAHNTEWWRVAEERNFIVVFTQATPNQNSTCGTARWRSGYKNPNSRFPEFDTQEAGASELAYFRRVVESVSENYNIDKTRIYCTGHSNGSEMTYVISEELTDIFAATAMVGMSTKEFAALADMPEQKLKMPYINVESEFDRTTDPDDVEKGLYWELCYRLKRNGIDPLAAAFTQNNNGLYTTRAYQNAQGFPMVQYCLYSGACHAYFPEVSYLVWDEFFCNYSRSEDGTTYYRGNAVE